MCSGAEGWGDFIGGQNRANREAAAQGFGGAENIGCYAVMLVANSFARHDPCQFVLTSKISKAHVCRINGVRLADILEWQAECRFTLNRLENHGAGFVR